jgi:hypothetical protein
MVLSLDSQYPKEDLNLVSLEYKAVVSVSQLRRYSPYFCHFLSHVLINTLLWKHLNLSSPFGPADQVPHPQEAPYYCRNSTCYNLYIYIHISGSKIAMNWI